MTARGSYNYCVARSLLHHKWFKQ